jgi:hypothetical protein
MRRARHPGAAAGPRDDVDAFGQRAARNAPRLELLRDRHDAHALREQSSQIRCDARRVALAPVADLQAARVLGRDRVVHGIAREEHGEIRAGAAHSVGDPEDGVVLLFERRAIGDVHDLKGAHDVS